MANEYSINQEVGQYFVSWAPQKYLNLYYCIYGIVRQLLRSFGSFTVEDRQALNVCKWKLFWIKAAFTIWYEGTVL